MSLPTYEIQNLVKYIFNDYKVLSTSTKNDNRLLKVEIDTNCVLSSMKTIYNESRFYRGKINDRVYKVDDMDCCGSPQLR